jgi:hypothetical protein
VKADWSYHSTYQKDFSYRKRCHSLYSLIDKLQPDDLIIVPSSRPVELWAIAVHNKEPCNPVWESAGIRACTLKN